jgi:heme/copper-type cytochrome/quinol oxidase subunit 1
MAAQFFTMSQSADVNATFGIATMTIGVPTGVKIYDWIWTMFRGEVRPGRRSGAPILRGTRVRPGDLLIGNPNRGGL